MGQVVRVLGGCSVQGVGVFYESKEVGPMDIHVWLWIACVVTVLAACRVWSRIKWLAISVMLVASVPLGLLALVVH
jgi:hypothetical protein